MLAISRGGGRAASSTATGCGTTPRASATGTRSGPSHGIRILPGPSSLWLDATGKRLPVPLYPGLRHAGHARAHHAQTGHDYTWFVLTQKIIEKEFALSGSEQNPDLTSKSIARGAASRASARARPARWRRSSRQGADFVVERDLADARARDERADRRAAARARRRRAGDRRARSRDRERLTRRTLQITAIRGARALPRRTGSRASPRPHRILDPKAGPLIAVRLHILTRKTLGGLQTDLSQPRARRRRRAAPGPVRRRRGGGLRRRRRARLPLARGHVPRRLPVLRADRRPRGRGGNRIALGFGDMGERSNTGRGRSAGAT